MPNTPENPDAARISQRYDAAVAYAKQLHPGCAGYVVSRNDEIDGWDIEVYARRKDMQRSDNSQALAVLQVTNKELGL